ncbi:hypothetical protein AFLA_013019 [Aspergillus flavus NRRL3357]|nr:hypothetical protein AFLA_013019 [Aspergillus flavus NRRL3357]
MSATARGRSPNRSPLDPGPEQASTPMRRTMSPRSESRPGSERSPSSDHVRRNGYRSRSRSRSASRSRMLSRSRSRSWSSRSRSRSRGSRRCRDRSYSETPSPSDNLPRSSKIVVEKLTKNVTESHLREIFGSFGGIESLDLPMNKAFMTNRGTAYILFNDPADAEAAIAHMHEAQLDGAVLNVSIVLPRRAFSQSPPPQSGRLRSSSPRRGRRRSPSYSSYDYSSHSDRSRSPSRSRGPGRYGPQRR